MMIAPATNWSGLYVGGNMGGVWNDHAVNFGGTGLAPAARAAGVIPTQLSESPAGFLGGLQLGYNFNWGPVLLGVETDAQYSGLNDSSSHTATTSSGPFVTPTTTAQQSMDFFGTLRGRVGFTPFGSTLIYGTGGLAYGHVGVSSSVESTPCTAGFCNSRNTDDVHVGWTGGGGIEMAVAPQLSLKVEYLYYDLGTINQSYSDFAGRFGGTSVTTHTAFNGNVLRLGVNYHFGAPPPPPPAPAAMPAPPPAAAKVFIVFFDWDRDTITPEGQQIIQQAADAYESGSPVQLQVTGYTDRSGSPGYNQRLSERRANNVARALAALGVPKEQMSVSGRGENDNRVPTADGVREPQNRRVEIVSP
jgi:outer membrane immunogenic protein